MSAQLDPIFAAIEPYEFAEAECDRIHEADEADEARLDAASEESRRALAETAPTTLGGSCGNAYPRRCIFRPFHRLEPENLTH